MKEINDIIKSYEIAKSANKKTALATVVQVIGSSYRRAGARMLVTEDGMLTGAISGGCLEGDALRKALLAIADNTNKLVTYDTTNDDDAKFGVQLGCNGIVHILFEPIDNDSENNPIYLLKKTTEFRSNAILITLFSLEDIQQIGTVYFKNNNEVIEQENNKISLALKNKIHQLSDEVFLNKISVIEPYRDEEISTNIFVEFIKPAISLVVCGAGNDAQPLAEMSYLVGWNTTIIDGRRTHATTERFPTANFVKLCNTETALENINIDEQTAFVLMTHNYNYDIDMLKQLVQTNCQYIGILGPKKKLQRMFDELATTGFIVSEEDQQKIFSPIGLDIGAETSAEIALSITAEIKGFMSKKNGLSLRLKTENIHH